MAIEEDFKAPQLTEAETEEVAKKAKNPYSFLSVRNKVLIYPQPSRATLVEKARVVCFRKRAARCYESRTPTGDVFTKSFEQRDDFVSITNTQMSSG